MDAFDQVIEKLRERGAFEDVPYPEGVPRAHEFKSLKPGANFPLSVKRVIFRYGENVPQAQSDYQFDNIRVALNAYAPQDVMMPWIRAYTGEALRAPLSADARQLLTNQLAFLMQELAYRKSQDAAMQTHPSVKLGPSDVQKETVDEHEIALQVLEKSPAFATAVTLFHAAHLEFLCGVAQRLRDAPMFSADEKKMAAEALQKLSGIFSTDNFLTPTIKIANAYHMRVAGDHRKPMDVSDFVVAWKTAYYGNSFHSRMTNPDGTAVVSRCPFKSRATQASAQIAGDEIVTTNRHSIRNSLGYGAWCLYSAASKINVASVRRFFDMTSILHDARKIAAMNDPYAKAARPYEQRMHDLVGSLHGLRL